MSDFPTALRSLIDSEHATIYSYGVIAGNVHRLQRKLAIQGLARHRELRNMLIDIADELKLETPQAQDGYEIPIMIDSHHSAVAAATEIELNLCAIWANTATLVSLEHRTLWAASAQDCSRRAYQWSKISPSFPS